MRVAMIGSGYVGLVSGACFAELGHTVTCVDKDAGKIEALRNGRMPIYEPGLAELVARSVAERRLSFTTGLAGAVEGAEAVFIAVGTPSRPADGLADLTYVYQAAREIARRAQRLCGGRDEVDRAGGDWRRDPTYHSRYPTRRRPVGGLQPGVPARRRRDPGFHGARPGRRRHRRCAGARGHDRALSAPSPTKGRRSCTRPAAAPSSSSTPPTPSWPPRLPSSTRSPTCASRPMPTSRRWRTASASTTASARSF